MFASVLLFLSHAGGLKEGNFKSKDDAGKDDTNDPHEQSPR